MEDAAGSADREMGVIQDSLDYKLNAFKQTWIGVGQELIDRGDIGVLIDMFTKLSEVMAKLVETGNHIPVLFGLIGGAINMVTKNAFADSTWSLVTSGAKNVGKLFNGNNQSEFVDLSSFYNYSATNALAEINKNIANDQSLQNFKGSILKTLLNFDTYEYDAIAKSIIDDNNMILDSYQSLDFNTIEYEPIEVSELIDTDSPLNLSEIIDVEPIEMSKLVDMDIDIDSSGLDGLYDGFLEDSEQIEYTIDRTVNAIDYENDIINLENASLRENTQENLNNANARLTNKELKEKDILQTSLMSAARDKETLSLFTETYGLEKLDIETIKHIASLDTETLATELATVSNKQLTEAERLTMIQTAKNTVYNYKMATSSKVLAATMSLLKTAAMGALFALASWGISAIINKWKETHKSLKDLTEEAEKASDAIKDLRNELSQHKDTVGDIKDTYAELAQGVGNLGTAWQNQGTLSTEDYEKFLDYSNQLAELYPELTKGYDDNGNAILDLTGNVDGITDSINKLVEAETQLANKQILDNMSSVFTGYKANLDSLTSELNKVTFAYEEEAEIIEAILNGGEYQSSLLTTDKVLEWFDSIAKNRTGDNDWWYDWLTRNEGVFNASNYVVDEMSGLFDFSTLSLTTQDKEYIQQYYDNLYAEYQKNSRELQNQINSASAQLKTGVDALLNSNLSYLAMNDTSRNLVDSVVADLDFAQLISDGIITDLNASGDIDWDDVSKWINSNIIYAMNDIDDEEIQEAMEKLITGGLSVDESGELYQQVLDYLTGKMGLTEDTPIMIFWKAQMAGSDDVLNDIEHRLFNTTGFKSLDTILGLEGINEDVDAFLRGLDAADLLLLQSQSFEGFAQAEDKVQFLMDLLTVMQGKFEETRSSISDSVEKLNKELNSQFGDLANVYQSIFFGGEDNTFDPNQIDNASLKSIMDAFDSAELAGVDFDKNAVEQYFKVLADGVATTEEAQEAFNGLATEWFYATNVLDDLNVYTAKSIEQQLEQMGIINATDVIDFNLYQNQLNELIRLNEEYAEATGKNKEVIEAEIGAIEKYLDMEESEIQAKILDIQLTDETRQAYFNLYLQKQLVNNEGILTANDVDSLISLATACGLAGEQFEQLIQLRNLFNQYEGAGKGSAKAQQEIRNQIELTIAELQKTTSLDLNIGLNYKVKDKNSKSSSGSGSGKTPDEEYLDKYEEELKVLEYLRDNDFIDEKEYLDQMRKLTERYFKDKDKFAEEYYKKIHEYLEGIKKLYEEAASAATSFIDDQVDEYNELLEKTKKQYEEDQKAAEEAQKAKIDAKQDEIDALEKANQKRQEEIDLQKALYEMNRAENQRTKLVKYVPTIKATITVKSVWERQDRGKTKLSLFRSQRCGLFFIVKRRWLSMKILPRNRIKKKRAKTNEEFIHEIKQLNPNLIIKGNYINAHTPMRFICTVCSHSWDKSPNAALKYYNCTKCSNRYSYTSEEFETLIKYQGDKNIKLISRYINANTKVEFICLRCGKPGKSFPYNLLNGTGCDSCNARDSALNRTLKIEDINNRLKSKNPNIVVVGKYINGHEPVATRCLLCDNVWYPSVFNLLKPDAYNNGCPNCSSSKGESAILSFLNSNNIKCNTQKKFNGLLGIGGKPLSYDFYLPKYNKLIEFQGIQHQKPIETFGGEKQFKRQQEHDKRKREYAKNNNIDLIEIWYYDIDNIEQILKEKLNLESVETVEVS